MKRALILFAVFFLLTLAVPMFAAFIKDGGGSGELVNIFRSALTLL